MTAPAFQDLELIVKVLPELFVLGGSMKTEESYAEDLGKLYMAHDGKENECLYIIQLDEPEILRVASKLDKHILEPIEIPSRLLDSSKALDMLSEEYHELIYCLKDLTLLICGVTILFCEALFEVVELASVKKSLDDSLDIIRR